MTSKHRGKAAQAAWAAKQGEKIARARQNFNPDAARREAERDHEYVLEQAASLPTHGIDTNGQPFAYETQPLPALNPEVAE